MPSRVFLLSPANCRGRRAEQLLAPRSTTDVASHLRSEAGVAIRDLAEGKISRVPQTALSTCTYFSDAMLPRSTTSPSNPTIDVRARALLFGFAYVGQVLFRGKRATGAFS